MNAFTAREKQGAGSALHPEPVEGRFLYGLIALLALILTGLAPKAHADELSSPILPWQAPTLRSNGFSLLDNPANLGWMHGLHGGLALQLPIDGDSGVGVAGAMAAAWPRLGGFGAALTHQDGISTLTAGFAASAGWMSVGFAGTRWFSNDTPALDGFWSSRVSLSLRLRSWLGVAFALEHPTSPRLAGRPVPREYAPSLGLRTPGGSFEADLHYRRLEGVAESDRLGATLLARLVPGVRLFGTVDFNVHDPGDSLRATLGLELASRAGTVSGAGIVTQRNGGTETALGLQADWFSHPGPHLTPGTNYLYVELAGTMAEAPSIRLWQRAPGFTDTLVTLYQAAHEPRIQGVVLRLNSMRLGTAQLFELRDAMLRVQDAGKKVVVVLDSASIRDLYLATAADFRIAHPGLSILPTGLGTGSIHIADLLDRLGIRADFVRIGDHKSAPEQFTRPDPSPPALRQIGNWLDDAWTQIHEPLATTLPTTNAAEEGWMLDRVWSAQMLEREGFVHALAHADELDATLESLLGTPVRLHDSLPDSGDWWFSPNNVAVLHINGAIVEGSGHGMFRGRQTGADSIRAACESIRSTPGIRAVIVRVDSPGGSASASEQIHRALSLLGDTLPVYVSMGNTAASGGIYVASFGAPIYAAPGTLTGSIGIYAGTFGLERLLDRLGINRVMTERGGRSSLFDGRAWRESERERVYQHIENAYTLFLDRVAQARGMEPDQVNWLGQGRIWSGMAAQERGLIDSTQGFGGALDAVRTDLGLDPRAPVTLQHYPSSRMGVGRLLRSGMNAQDTELSLLGELLNRLGLAPALELLLAGTPGEAMAMLEWVVEPF